MPSFSAHLPQMHINTHAPSTASSNDRNHRKENIQRGGAALMIKTPAVVYTQSGIAPALNCRCHDAHCPGCNVIGRSLPPRADGGGSVNYSQPECLRMFNRRIECVALWPNNWRDISRAIRYLCLDFQCLLYGPYARSVPELKHLPPDLHLQTGPKLPTGQ
ncbi:uncharacterized protein BDV14DRAFT_5778 [Aspergillus stella-maris]|uniref:uncharacterized protein n=1 Tax=Aspergillus stella-maris TaxID=1810926 RepID=UPI003CCDB580